MIFKIDFRVSNKMLAKLLKRKESRHVIVDSTLQVQERSSSTEKNGIQQQEQQQQQPLLQYGYQRPDLLGKVD